MRGVFTWVGLLIVVAVIGMLTKKQMSALAPTGLPPEISTQGSVPAALTHAPLQKLPDEFKKALDESMQKSRLDEAAQ